MKKLTISLTAAMLLIAGGASAEDTTGKKLGVRESKGYGPAGCGLGSLVFSPDSGFTQIFAATTNGTSYTQTFGISTGTSNCDDSSGGSASAKAFVQTNRLALVKDVARGGGETIEGLAELAGCSDAAAVGSALQKNFDAIFPSSDASNEQVSESVIETLRADASLACKQLG
jgi:hypothetical protein